jgi:hypothetical protein
MSDTTSKNVRLSEESEASHLLINVAQVLVEVIHDVEDRKVPEDTIAGQRGGELEGYLNQPKSPIRINFSLTLTKGGPPVGYCRYNPG